MRNKVLVAGISPEGISSLSPAVCQKIMDADILLGGWRLLDMFPLFAGEKVQVKNNLSKIVNLIKENLEGKRMVVLASGDPGFYGIARYLSEKLGKSNLEIAPSVSSIQLAFARIGESWDDAALVSVHSRPIEDIVDVVRSRRKIGILTDDKNTPANIASLLSQHNIENCRVYVCQDIGTEQEKIEETDIEGLKESEFSALNVLILLKDTWRDVEPRQLMGIADSRFKQPTDGQLITKQEIRAVSLAKLALRQKSTVWDIGAGSGAVAIEASFLASKGSVLAIEKNADFIAVIQENIRNFGCNNVSVIQALAPDKLGELPDPDSVFIGGSGGKMGEILRFCCRCLKPDGRIVINAATLETLQQATDGLKQNNFDSEVILVNVARSKSILDLTRLEALNPVFVISGWRKE